MVMGRSALDADVCARITPPQAVVFLRDPNCERAWGRKRVWGREQNQKCDKDQDRKRDLGIHSMSMLAQLNSAEGIDYLSKPPTRYNNFFRAD
ncbi:hypothetical protein EVAR_84989_1 [Eumeta japonica]|uniref:Uncharacterized protein n=1 Tax=Eumeta variegata TaxID=151549 RepID=A0A4C1WB71_EUMVA|nr:hypothetical protein EVAR_84989_1 [Eumeta japonica]